MGMRIAEDSESISEDMPEHWKAAIYSWSFLGFNFLSSNTHIYIINVNIADFPVILFVFYFMNF